MLPFSDQQYEVLRAPAKRLSWLFEVNTPAGVRRWSTKQHRFQGKEYEFKILPATFAGVRLQRSRPEMGQIPPVEIEFVVSNPKNEIQAADLLWSTLVLRLVLSDYARELEMLSFRMDIVSAVSTGQQISVRATDFLAKFLDGDWPATKLVADLSPDDQPRPDPDICLPELFGEAFLRLRPLVLDGQAWYVLGLASRSYTVSEVRSPANAPKSSWKAIDGYQFQQSTRTIDSVDYRVLQPLVADGACGIWIINGQLQDIRCRFERSDTAALTNFADAIAAFLRMLGVPAWLIDTGAGSSFTYSREVFALRGLVCSGGWDTRQGRMQTLCNLLVQCNATLDVRDKVYLRPLETTPAATVGSAEVLRTASGRTSYSYSPVLGKQPDSGYVSWQQAGEPTDQLVKTLLPAVATTANISSISLRMGLLHDPDHVARAGQLFFQRRLDQIAMPAWSHKLAGLAIQPDDLITVSGADYGGIYEAVIDELTIGKSGFLSIRAIQYSETLAGWNDLAPGTITVNAADLTGAWQPVLAGPDSEVSGGEAPNRTNGTAIVQTPWAQVLGRPYVTVHPTRGEGEFQTLASALSALSSSGGAILLRNATYADVSVTLPDAPIEITGESRDGVVMVSPAATDRILTVPANGLAYKLSGLTMRAIGGAVSGAVGVTGVSPGGRLDVDGCAFDLRNSLAYGIKLSSSPLLSVLQECDFFGTAAMGLIASAGTTASGNTGQSVRVIGGTAKGLAAGISLWTCPDVIVSGISMTGMKLGDPGLIVIAGGAVVRGCILSLADQQYSGMCAVRSYGGAVVVSGNLIELTSNYDPNVPGALRAAVYYSSAGDQSRVVDNIITITVQAATGNYDAVRGIICPGNSAGIGQVIRNNFVTMILGGDHITGTGIEATAYRSQIGGNNIRMTGQASASLVGISLNGNDNTGGDNMVIGADLALADNGSGNQVTARLL